MTMTNYQTEEDNYKSLRTIHVTPPTQIIEVVQNHEIYNELNQGVNGQEPLEWTEEEYEPEELKEIVKAFKSDFDGDLNHWRLNVNTLIGEDVMDVVPETAVTGVLNYELEIKGYGTSETDLEIKFFYDESKPETWLNIALSGEKEFDFPDHFTPRDMAEVRRNFIEDLERQKSRMLETIENTSYLEL